MVIFKQTHTPKQRLTHYKQLGEWILSYETPPKTQNLIFVTLHLAEQNWPILIWSCFLLSRTQETIKVLARF